MLLRPKTVLSANRLHVLYAVRIAVALVLSILLAGCGFQSVKPLQLASEWQPIELSAHDSLEVTFKRELLARKIAIADTTFNSKNYGDNNAVKASTPQSKISINNIQRQQRNNSVSLGGKNAEFLLILTADFVWRELNVSLSDGEFDESANDDNVLLRRRLSAETIIYSNPSNPGAERSEVRRAQQLLEKKLSQEFISIMAGQLVVHGEPQTY